VVYGMHLGNVSRSRNAQSEDRRETRINLVLFLVLIAEFSIALCAWLSPDFLRRIAAHLLTRADVIEVSRKEAKRRMQFWSKELHIQTSATEQARDTIASVHAIARR